MDNFEYLVKKVTEEVWMGENKPEWQEKSMKFDEAKGVLETLFPTQELISEHHGRLIDSVMNQMTEERLFRLLNPAGEEVSRLRKYVLARHCFCGCNDRGLRELYYIEPSTKVKETTWRASYNVKKGILLDKCYSENRRDYDSHAPRVAKDFWTRVPGAMDEWLKIQFNKKAE